jgi:hypothetical protein
MLALVSARNGEILKYPQFRKTMIFPFFSIGRKTVKICCRAGTWKPVTFWKIPLDGSQPEQIREWENDAIFRLAISRNGERVFYEVGNQLNSVLQFQNLD